MFIRVTNNGTESFTSKFNGLAYEFAPKKPITLDADAARHIFGLGLADKREVLSRHGWLSHSSGVGSASVAGGAGSGNTS